MDDHPYNPNGSTVTFQTTIVGKSKGLWRAIKTYKWGYKVVNGKTIKIDPHVISNPSTFHSNLVKAALKYHNH